jgi:hypothetical protein
VNKLHELLLQNWLLIQKRPACRWPHAYNDFVEVVLTNLNTYVQKVIDGSLLNIVFAQAAFCKDWN